MCSITDTQGGAKGFKITSLKSKVVLHRIPLLLSLWVIPHLPHRELLAICEGQQKTQLFGPASKPSCFGAQLSRT